MKRLRERARSSLLSVNAVMVDPMYTPSDHGSAPGRKQMCYIVENSTVHTGNSAAVTATSTTPSHVFSCQTVSLYLRYHITPPWCSRECFLSCLTADIYKLSQRPLAVSALATRRDAFERNYSERRGVRVGRACLRGGRTAEPGAVVAGRDDRARHCSGRSRVHGRDGRS